MSIRGLTHFFDARKMTALTIHNRHFGVNPTLVSPAAKRILNSNPAFPGGTDSVWEKLPNAISSQRSPTTVVLRVLWNNLTLAVWGRGVEILIYQVTMALTDQVKIYASLLANIGVRYRGQRTGIKRYFN
jgi:hypothetical protein